MYIKAVLHSLRARTDVGSEVKGGREVGGRKGEGGGGRLGGGR